MNPDRSGGGGGGGGRLAVSATLGVFGGIEVSTIQGMLLALGSTCWIWCCCAFPFWLVFAFLRHSFMKSQVSEGPGGRDGGRRRQDGTSHKWRRFFLSEWMRMAWPSKVPQFIRDLTVNKASSAIESKPAFAKSGA